MYATTLCFLVRGTNVLLVRHMKSTFGCGIWNGYGGKAELGVTIEASALRVLTQESGVVAQLGDLERVAVIDYAFTGNPRWSQQVHTFILRHWQGTPADSSDIVQAHWFGFTEVPYNSMWPADRYWLPPVLGGKKIRGQCQFADVKTKQIQGYIFAPVPGFTYGPP